MKDFLKEIGINRVGEYSDDGSYVIELDNSNQWGTFYSKLENSDLLEKDEDSSLLTIENASQIYLSDEYQLVLVADFDNEIYKLVVNELQ